MLFTLVFIRPLMLVSADVTNVTWPLCDGADSRVWCTEGEDTLRYHIMHFLVWGLCYGLHCVSNGLWLVLAMQMQMSLTTLSHDALNNNNNK